MKKQRHLWHFFLLILSQFYVTKFQNTDSLTSPLRNFQQVNYVNFVLLIRGTRERRQWHPTPVLLPGKSHGWRSLVGCSPWDCEESDTTERLHFHFSLSCIGEGNGNPLQCSCLENPRVRQDWSDLAAAADYKKYTRSSSSTNKSQYWLFSYFFIL